MQQSNVQLQKATTLMGKGKKMLRGRLMPPATLVRSVLFHVQLSAGWHTSCRTAYTFKGWIYSRKILLDDAPMTLLFFTNHFDHSWPNLECLPDNFSYSQTSTGREITWIQPSFWPHRSNKPCSSPVKAQVDSTLHKTELSPHHSTTPPWVIFPCSHTQGAFFYF